MLKCKIAFRSNGPFSYYLQQSKWMSHDSTILGLQRHFGAPIEIQNGTRPSAGYHILASIFESKGHSWSNSLHLKLISHAVEHHIKHEKGIYFLLATPCFYRTNAAEKPQTCKNNFISALATIYPSFPVNLWCLLVPLDTATFNI